MNDWDATDYAAKETVLRVVRLEAEALFAMAEASDSWTAATACPGWEVRDVVGHLIDVTESYFTSFDAAAAGQDVDKPLGLKVMPTAWTRARRATASWPRARRCSGCGPTWRR